MYHLDSFAKSVRGSDNRVISYHENKTMSNNVANSNKTLNSKRINHSKLHTVNTSSLFFKQPIRPSHLTPPPAIMNSVLIDASVTGRTRNNYDRHVIEFFAFLQSHNWTVSNVADMDAGLVHYCTYKFNLAYAPAAGTNAYSGIIRLYPQWKLLLPFTKMALKGWARLMPPKSRPPISWPLAVAVAIRAVAWGYPNVGIAVILGFHCYLRIGEMLNIRVNDVADVGDARASFGNARMFIRLAQTKTGPNQDAVIYNPVVAHLIRFWISCRRKDPKQFLFGCTEREFRTVFRNCCASWQLPSDIVPHSLRHGGATYAHVVDGIDAATIKLRGRWKSDKSFMTYIQSMRSALVTTAAPKASVDFGSYVSSDLISSFYFTLLSSHSTPHSVAAKAALSQIIRLPSPSPFRITSPPVASK